MQLPPTHVQSADNACDACDGHHHGGGGSGRAYLTPWLHAAPLPSIPHPVHTYVGPEAVYGPTHTCTAAGGTQLLPISYCVARTDQSNDYCHSPPKQLPPTLVQSAASVCGACGGGGGPGCLPQLLYQIRAPRQLAGWKPARLLRQCWPLLPLLHPPRQWQLLLLLLLLPRYHSAGSGQHMRRSESRFPGPHPTQS